MSSAVISAQYGSTILQNLFVISFLDIGTTDGGTNGILLLVR